MSRPSDKLPRDDIRGAQVLKIELGDVGEMKIFLADRVVTLDGEFLNNLNEEIHAKIERDCGPHVSKMVKGIINVIGDHLTLTQMLRKMGGGAN